MAKEKEKVEASAREVAWETFRLNMEKWDKARHDRLQKEGYFDKIPDGFTS